MCCHFQCFVRVGFGWGQIRLPLLTRTAGSLDVFGRVGTDRIGFLDSARFVPFKVARYVPDLVRVRSALFGSNFKLSIFKLFLDLESSLVKLGRI